MRAAGADGSPCRPTCSVDPRCPRAAGDGGSTRRRRPRDAGRTADRVDVAATEAEVRDEVAARRGGHRHRHPRAAAGRGRVPTARHGGRRRAAPVRCRAARPVARQGTRRADAASAGDDRDADPAHRRADRLRRPGDLDAARTARAAASPSPPTRSSSRRSRHGCSGPGSASSKKSAPGARPMSWRRASTRPTSPRKDEQGPPATTVVELFEQLRHGPLSGSAPRPDARPAAQPTRRTR